MASQKDIILGAISALSEISVGQEEVTKRIICCLLSGGHVLLEDLPGSGKTTLAKNLAHIIGGSFRRVQATPDLMPSDVIGASLFNPVERTFDLVRGPVFSNVLLVDEINRASPRTQSALLEAMGEGQVSIDGTTLFLDSPFFVIATQNPSDMHGTFPLPEAQLDRFAMRLGLQKLTKDDETLVILNQTKPNHCSNDQSILDGHVFSNLILQSACSEVASQTISESLALYISSIAAASRSHPDLSIGISTRAALSLARAAQAYSWLEGSPCVLPSHIRDIALDCLSHRVKVADRAKLSGSSGRQIIKDIIELVTPPVASEV